MASHIKVDAVIIGAGIAGLWLHHRLNDMGLYALLLDNVGMGSGQTLSSQGIIHGGTKYTLNGLFSNAASAIAAMPERWKSCLEGNGEINLSSTNILSPHQLMWSTQGLSSKITSFFSSKALQGKVTAMSREDYPACFQNSQFRGHLYQLNEPVLDVPSLIENLSKTWRHRMIKAPKNIKIVNQAQSGKLILDETVHIDYQECILTAGEGNEALLKPLNITAPAMQRRPLHMVLAKSNTLPPLYAHCVGASTKPLATITTHRHQDGEWVWYIGGNIAEEGVTTDHDALIKHTQSSLQELLPWVSLDNAQWATHRVNRAEPAQSNLLRPDTAFIESIDNIHIAWPTKLALTPDLSDRALALINKRIHGSSVTDAVMTDQQLNTLEPCPLSPSLWERIFDTNH